MEWLTNNLGTVIAGLLLAAAVIWAILRIRKNRKEGKCSCGGSCGNCPEYGLCHQAGALAQKEMEE